MNTNTIDNEDIKNWLQDMRAKELAFDEPHLDHMVSEKAKLFCDGLDQDDHVFGTAIAILDKYIAVHNKLKMKIKDPFIIVLTAVYIAGKLSGDLAEMKTLSLTSLYAKIMKRPIDNAALKRVEINILTMLDYKLPLFTQIDDVKMLVLVYVDSLNLQICVQDLTVNVFSFYLINRMSLFKQLCHFYAESDDLCKTFKPLYVNRFYVPFAVIICVLNMLSLPVGIVNVDLLSRQFGDVCHISSEHLCFLAHLIHELWQQKKES